MPVILLFGVSVLTTLLENNNDTYRYCRIFLSLEHYSSYPSSQQLWWIVTLQLYHKVL